MILGRGMFALKKCHSLDYPVLDLGSYSGAVSGNIPNNGLIIGMDINKEAIIAAHPEYKNVHPLVADATACPLKGDRISLIFLLDVLEHVHDERKCINEMNRILKDRGRVILSVPHKSPLSIGFDPDYKKGHRHYSADEIKCLFKDSFYITNIYYCGFISNAVSSYVYGAAHIVDNNLKLKGLLTKSLRNTFDYLAHVEYFFNFGKYSTSLVVVAQKNAILEKSVNSGSAPVTIVIPTLNRAEILLNTLKSLVNQRYSQYEIIIIDSSEAPDPSLQSFIGEYNFIKYFKTGKYGPSAAKNLGIHQATNEIIIFCDDDVRPVEGFIQAHVKNYSDPTVGGIAGRVISKNDTPSSKIKEVGKFRFDGSMISNFNAGFRSEVDHVYGCNMSFRRDILVKIGGFSLDFPGNAYFEEADLAMRVKKLGYRLIFDPDAMVTHLIANEGGVRLHSFHGWVYNYIHNSIILLKKHFNPLVFPLFLLRQGFWCIIWTIYHKDIKIPGIMVTAMWNGFRDAHLIKRVDKKGNMTK